MEISKKISLEEYCKGVDEFYKDLMESNPNFKNLKKNMEKFYEYSKDYSKKILNIGNNIPNDNSFAGAFCNVAKNMILSISKFFSEISKIIEEINYPDNLKELKNSLETTYSNYKISGKNVIDFNTRYNQNIESYERYLMKDVIMFAKNGINKDIIKEGFRTSMVSTYNESVFQTKSKLNELLGFANSFSDGCKNICKKFLVHMKEAIENLKNYYELENSSFIKINEEIINFKENMEFKNYKYPLLSLKIYLQNHGQINTENDLEKNKGITLETIEKIIENLKKNNIEINDQDLEYIEKKKATKIFREKCDIITSRDITIEEKDKDKIIKYIKKEGEYPRLFLTELNQTRTKTYLISNDDTFNFFSKIISIINDIAVKKDDYDLFEYYQVMGITFFKMDNNNKKIYLNYLCKNNEKLNHFDFWLKFVSFINRREEKKKNRMALFSIVGTTCQHIFDSGFDFKFMDAFVEKAKIEFNLSQKDLDYISIYRKDIGKKNKK